MPIARPTLRQRRATPTTGRAPAAPNGWRETATVLALFALLLNLVIDLMPMPPGGFGAMAGDPASLCMPGGAPPGDQGPRLPGAQHDCVCCLAQPLNWAAVIPSAATIVLPIVVAAAPIAAEAPAIVARPHTGSRPRAPPRAA